MKEYADSLLREPGGDLGQVAYLLVAVQQFNAYAFVELFKKSGLNWPDVKAGFELRERVYGFSNEDWNIYLYLACAADDHATAKEVVQHFGEWISLHLAGEALVRSGYCLGPVLSLRRGMTHDSG
ncbi:hypothetical protein [Mesorhizobium sp. WSM4313]|uniref:hypothetical protein n=1 Tax=Mesorhizobium sp. WSM4313 TaxID=2029412 RepID=UPI0011409692|nr:hypothetical protein [Mesorhizobium sp. WSM4313]